MTLTVTRGGGSRHDVEVAGSTTTITVGPDRRGPPAIGAGAGDYVGLEIRSRSEAASDVWTVDGHPLAYLTVADQSSDGPGRSALLVHDGGAAMVWLLEGSWPGGGTVVDAIDVPVDAQGALGTDRSTSAGDPVVALVRASSPAPGAPMPCAAPGT